MTDKANFKTPILLLVFNRPEVTRKVMDEIRKIKPMRLYISADGPRKHVVEDLQKTKETRAVFDAVDWECDVQTLYQENNLGCGNAQATGISWFFDREEEGIILEDDCIPDPSFFRFCEELLAFFRVDERIMMISGFNFNNVWGKDYSYFFSYYGSCWGWASWRRAWRHYDNDMLLWKHPEVKKNLTYALCQQKEFMQARFSRLEKVYRGEIGSFAYKWGLARFVNSGLTIIPTKNLIENVGFGLESTNTKKEPKRLIIDRAHEASFPLIHSPFVVPDRKYDNIFMRHQHPHLLRRAYLKGRYLYNIYKKKLLGDAKY